MGNNTQGMSLIVKTVTRLTVGLILIYGIYIVLVGHLSPGGGFAGGVIVALSFIHLMLAFGKDAVLNKLNGRRALVLASLGGIAFLFLAGLGFMGLHGLLASKGNFKLSGAHLIPLCDIAISVMVGMGLFVIFLALVLLAEEREAK